MNFMPIMVMDLWLRGRGWTSERRRDSSSVIDHGHWGNCCPKTTALEPKPAAPCRGLTALQGHYSAPEKKKDLEAEASKSLSRLRYFGSPTWARTRDLRINSLKTAPRVNVPEKSETI